MKIAQYHGPQGKGDNVRFIKGEDKDVLDTCWDRIYVTTLFSFEWKRISESIDFAIEASGGQANNVFVGGIAASLMQPAFLAETRWRGVRFIKGLLKDAPAVSLQLDAFAEELYSEDTNGNSIEDLIPDYSILSKIAYTYPVHDAYFAYASRGCVRKCSFCGVPKLEGDLYDTPSLSKIVEGINALYGPKKDLVLMDNNVVAVLKGKKDWRPYEQASFLHRRHYKDKVSISNLVKEVPLKTRGIEHRIAVIDYMIKQGDNKIARWSHYDELLKNRKIQAAFKDHAGFEEAVVMTIKSGNIKAVEVRDKLKVVCRTKSEKPIKQFIGGATIDDAVKTAKSLGGDHIALNTLKRFRLWVVEGDTKRDIKSAPEKVRQQIVWELRKIKTQVSTLLNITAGAGK